MDRATSLEARQIDLTIELPFKLGDVRVDPPAHEITWSDNARRLQPQTMKVLVALHDKIGQVVTRDELVDRCWNARFVGEDVINRCISLLRRVAAETGGIEIQTVPRGGYRLLEPPAELRNDSIRPPATLLDSPIFTSRRRWTAALAAMLLIIVCVSVVLVSPFRRPAQNRVVLKAFEVAGNSPAARTLADGVSADVGRALSTAGVHVVEPRGVPQVHDAGFVLGGRTELAGSSLHLTTELQDARDDAVLWSTSFTRPVEQIEALQEQVAANVAAVLQCALESSGQNDDERLDQDSIKLYLRACELQQAVYPSSNQIQDLLQQVTARQPRFAEGWARLAFFTANAAFSATPQEEPMLRRQARSEARRALELKPNSAMAREALIELELGHAPFAKVYRDVQVVMKLNPGIDDPAGDGSELLLRMGRMNDALDSARRGVEHHPFWPVQASDLVIALVDNSRRTEAEAILRQALRLWPDDLNLRVMNLDFETRFGNPDRALAILNNPDERPQRVRDVTLEAYRQLAEVRKSGDPGKLRAFTDWLKRQVVLGQVGVDFAVPHLAQFGDVNGAFKVAFSAPADVINIDPEFLWEPESLALRRDPRFIALAAKFGVADFWASTGMWPDFCSTPDWPYNCKSVPRKSALRG